MKGNIPTAVFEVVSRSANQTAMQVFKGALCDVWTFQDVGNTVKKFAAALRFMGIGTGDRVVILAENRPEWGIAYLGVVTIGATVVPFDVQYTSDEVKTLIQDCEPHTIIVTAQTYSLLPAREEKQCVITLDEPVDSLDIGFRDCIAKYGIAVEHVSNFSRTIPPDTVASLLYTSGTTGTPKGVLLSHENLLSNAGAIKAAGLATGSDNILSILPLHHAYPFMVSFLIPILLGARITFLQTLKGPELLACVREAEVSIVVGVPQVYAQFYRAMANELEAQPEAVQKVAAVLMGCSGFVRDWTNLNIGKAIFPAAHKRFGPTLRLLISGGARLDLTVARFLYRMGFTILEGYGLSETAPILTFNPLAKQKIGSVGRSMMNVDLQIAESDEKGIGEVTARGPNVMLGYFKNDHATTEMIHDGVLWTGDLGYFDQDGYLFLTGRKKELIVLAGGKNVYPDDVESVYRLSPAISDICVVGVEHSEEGGEALHAVVYPNFSYFKENKIGNVEEFIRSDLHGLSGRLASYKQVSGLTVVTEPLPRTRLGKLQRHRVRAMIDSAPTGVAPLKLSVGDEAMMSMEPAISIVSALRDVLGKGRSIRLDDHLGLDLGIDSLRRVEMVVALERKFGPLPESFGAEVATMRDIIARITDLRLAGTSTELWVDARGENLRSWADILKNNTFEVDRLPPHAHLISWQHRLQIWFGCGLLYLVARVGFRVSVSGVAHIPPRGPCLLAANHASFMDAFVVCGVVPYVVFERLFFFGLEQYFRTRFTAWFARGAHIVSVDAEKHLVNAMQTTAALLRRGKMVMIFPEGCRTLDGSLLPFRNGIGVLAAELGVPIVPVWIHGTYEAWPVGQLLPRFGKVAVSFGKPVKINADERKEWRFQGWDEYELATQKIREAVVELSCDRS
ncbi:MAG: hypothetical protein CMH81_01715 [Nitrospiraceae bacterium]|nr:hypothetical protein [Nitrospiraceae bacterium]